MKNLHGALIDLHLHLDGSISCECARALAESQNIKIPKSDSELKTLLSVPEDCKSLNEYLTKFDFPCSLLQTSDALEYATRDLLERLWRDGVIYAEIRFAPQKHTDKGLSQDEVVGAVIKGASDSKIPCGIILCLMRGDDNEEENAETVRVAKKYLGRGVVCADLAGAEALFPTKSFEKLFAFAKDEGVPFVIHAGEADGCESINAALDMGAVRIGHGVRAVEDAATLYRLAKNNIPIETCPKSNVDTQAFASISDFPIRKLLDAGVKVTVNTDNMSVSGTTLKAEFTRLYDAFALTDGEMFALVSNSADAAFASPEVKNELKAKIRAVFGK